MIDKDKGLMLFEPRLDGTRKNEVVLMSDKSYGFWIVVDLVFIVLFAAFALVCALNGDWDWAITYTALASAWWLVYRGEKSLRNVRRLYDDGLIKTRGGQ